MQTSYKILLFAAIWVVCDTEGIFCAEPKTLKDIAASSACEVRGPHFQLAHGGSAHVEADMSESKEERLSQITFPRDIDDLHQAVERLADNGILSIQPGVHRINAPLKIDRNIRINGATSDPEDVTIESSGEGCLVVTAENARVQWLTLQVKSEKKILGDEEFEKLSESEQKSFRQEGLLFSSVQVLQGESRFGKCKITSDFGHGVVVKGKNTNPVFTQCHMTNCGLNGIVVGEEAQGTFNNCEAYGNEHPGICVHENSNPKAIQCKFYDSKQSFGICVAENGIGTFENCLSYNNALSGCRVKENGNPKMVNCRFYDNKEGGIFIHEGGKGIFDNCKVYGNTMSGIEVKNENSDPTICNSTISNNGGSGIYIRNGGGGTYERNVLSGNTYNSWYVRDNPGKFTRTENSPNQ